MFGKPLARPFEYLARKLVRGFSPQLVIVGDETGIGKSMLGCRTAELVYYRAFGKEWKPTDNVYFKMSEFKTALFTSKNKIFIIEEAEIELGSDEWQSIQNKYFSRMKSTQRIKGNLYILILPMISQLALKHRRAINILFEVKWRGFFKAYKIVKKPAQIIGDDIYSFHMGDCFYNLPACKEEFDRLDEANKKRIEKEEGERLEQKLWEIKSKKERIMERNWYFYTCQKCKFTWDNSKLPSNNTICPRCKKYNFWNQGGVEVKKVKRLINL